MNNHKDSPAKFSPLEGPSNQIVPYYTHLPFDILSNEPMTSGCNLNMENSSNHLECEQTKHAIKEKPSMKKARRIKRYMRNAPTLTNDSNRSYDCDQCDEKFHMPSLLRLHKQTLHELLKPFRCPKCPEQFNFETNFTLHAAGHVRAGTCPQCGVQFRRLAALRGHLKNHLTNDNFHCKECREEFEYEETYQRHVCLEREEQETIDGLEDTIDRKKSRTAVHASSILRKFKCDICNCFFTKASNLARHKLTHTKVKSFQCDKCLMKFTQNSSLQRHVKTHTGEKRFKCSKCSMCFSQRGNLQTHIQRVHPRNPDLTNKFPCPNCSCVFNKLNSLNRHSAKMHSAKLSATIIGDNSDENSEQSFDRVMAQLKNLQSQYIDSTSDSSSLFPMGNVGVPIIGSIPIENEAMLTTNLDCGYVRIVETLNAEQEKSEVVVKQIEGDDGKMYYSCDICSKRFQRPYDLLRHNRVHTNEKPYKCGICDRHFALENNLQVHLRIHGKDGDRITNCYQCPKCFIQFSSLRQLDIHARSHEGLKLFPCKVCHKNFRSTNNLRVHEYIHRSKNSKEIDLRKNLLKPILVEGAGVSNIPTEENRRYQCSICGLRFNRSAHLTQHETSHAGLKPYQCLTCRRQFTTRSSLNTHQKIHYGHKTKKCGECSAIFRSNSELKRHETTHSTNRPYFCPYCKKSFKTRGTCRAHILSHTKDLTGESEKGVNETVNSSTPTEYIILTDEQSEAMQFDPNLLDAANVIYLNVDTNLANSNETSQETLQDINTFDGHFPEISQQSAKFIEIDKLLQKPSSQTIAKNITIQSMEKSEHSTKSTTSGLVTPFQFDKDASGRKHSCETCGRPFKKPIDLKRHIRTHTKERPFECGICHATFKLKCTLDTHKIVHNEKRLKFDCQVCGKSYSSQNVLKVHLRIHTNERPYKCKYCEKTFRTTGHKDAHISTHVKNIKDRRDRKKLKKKVNRIDQI